MDILDIRALQGEGEIETGGWPAGEEVPAGHELQTEIAEELEGEFPGESEGEFQLQDEQEYESELEQEYEPGQREEFEFEDEQDYGAAESEPAQTERYEEYEDQDHEHDLGGEADYETGYETGYEGEFEGPPTVPVSTGGGRLVVQHLPLLKQHVGTPPDLILGWNAMSNPGRVDVVVHLHGFSPRGQAMQLPRDMVPVSGLDFADPRQPATPGRRVPTLTVLPRGNFFGGRSGRGYNHPALHTPGALARLVDDALARFGEHTGIQAARGRLILTAHSGGGASLMRVLQYADPDEVHTFDALYTDPSSLITWARARIARNDGGALRVLYRDHEGTAAHSRTVRSAVRRALAAHPATPPARFRVEATPVEHMQIPPRFGWRLLADAGADVPDVRPAPSAPSPAPHEAEAFWDEAAAASAPLTTEQLRQAWAAYYCAEPRMVPIRLLSHTTPVNPLAVDAFRALARALAATGYQAKSTWVYNCRAIRAARPGQHTRASLHAYGLAVDIDPRFNPHRRHVHGPIQFSSAATQQGRMHDVGAGLAGTCFTPEQVAAVEAIRTVDGRPVFGWGGRWRSSHDAMHFEIRVTPAQLSRGIAPAGTPAGPGSHAESRTCEAWNVGEAEFFDGAEGEDETTLAIYGGRRSGWKAEGMS
ncbi:MAG: M15 family metallopeptidase [Micromonosporaceae bacterium]